MRDPDLEKEYRNEHGKIGELIYDAKYQGRDYKNDSFRVLQILTVDLGWAGRDTH